MMSPLLYDTCMLQPLNLMESAEQEERVVQILERLKTEVKHRGLLLTPFFSDLDKVSSRRGWNQLTWCQTWASAKIFQKRLTI